MNIIVLSPHADDVEIAMGGTIAKYVDEGHNITIITAILPRENIDGNTDEFMNKNRKKEQKKSANILGANLEILDLDPYDFALRASAKTWKEFGQPVPKPMYHGIWSASFLRDLKIEGNHLVLMKNLRNFTVQFELLRKTGVPV